jgi:hypothetical protein
MQPKSTMTGCVRGGFATKTYLRTNAQGNPHAESFQLVGVQLFYKGKLP